MKGIFVAGLVALAGSVGLGSVSAQSGAPAPAPSPAPLRSGQELFAAKCSHCHGKNGWGTRALARRMPPEYAELLRRDAIPASYVTHVVRRGLASMPQFTPTDLSDAELARLATWLETKQ